MKASTRPRDIGGGYGGRRNGNTLSISDTNHHVTEVLGNLYGDDEYNSRRESRPLSFTPESTEFPEEPTHTYNQRSSSLHTNHHQRPQPTVNGRAGSRTHTMPVMNTNGEYDNDPPSPSISIRDQSPLSPGDTAQAQLPLNDVDYESSPAAVAQELSNLQALRRMSMDVGNTNDPDLPSFQGPSLMPSVAPTGSDNEDDPSRLFWVPARVHPELAPMEFKTFLENRVNSIKRRSGDLSSLSIDVPERSGSTGSLSAGGGLQRKKSMLSRQIDNSGGRAAAGYQDGADRLVRKKSQSGQQALDIRISDLQELDALVKDPAKAVKGLSLDTSNRLHQAGLDVAEQEEDLPILPAAPGGMALRRSTRTTYRKGSLKKGERVPFSKRRGLTADADNDQSPISPATPSAAASPAVGSPLTNVSSEPTMENFSRPTKSIRRGAALDEPSPKVETHTTENSDEIIQNIDASPPSVTPNTLPESTAPARDYGSTAQRSETPVPKIIETPPAEEHTESPRANQSYQQHSQNQYPQRSSSQGRPPPTMEPSPQRELPAKSNKRPGFGRQDPPQISHKPKPDQTFEQMSQHPSPLPGSNARTDTLTFIPTLTEDKKSEKKRQEKEEGTRKTSWGWFKGSDDKDKKDKKKDESRDDSKKSRSKTSLDKSHENSRLDVLQNSIDGAIVRGRESLLLDRESIDNKLVEERKKESTRKSGEHKKEKDSLFSSIFGGKKRSDRETSHKKGSSLRSLSPEPPRRILKPDIDYPWTRFTILEERAIYRMAHIKLANPKRALQSQVLLSNFMYSYLAKVQQMHPQVQSPAAMAQKRLEAEKRQKELQLQQQQQQQQQYDYHSGISEYAEPSNNSQPQKSEGVTYVDDSQIYNSDHQNDETHQRNGSDRPQSRAAQHGNDQNPNHGYYHDESSYHDDDDENDDMW